MKKEQWKCIVFPEMDNIWMLLWAFKLCTLTFLRTGNPIGLKMIKIKSCYFSEKWIFTFNFIFMVLEEKICFVICVYIFGQVGFSHFQGLCVCVSWSEILKNCWRYRWWSWNICQLSPFIIGTGLLKVCIKIG